MEINLNIPESTIKNINALTSLNGVKHEDFILQAIDEYINDIIDAKRAEEISAQNEPLTSLEDVVKELGVKL
jgi:hypothetical protein